MKLKTKITIATLCLLMVLSVGIWYFTQPRTITVIEPGKISAFGVIDKIAPGNEITLYVAARNPSITESCAIDIGYLQPDKPYELRYNPFGEFDERGKTKNRISPAVVYEPAPPEAENWFTVRTEEAGWSLYNLWPFKEKQEITNWGIVSLLPGQEKALPFNISIPEGAELPKNWYFYVTSRDATGGGLVISRSACTVLVNMR
jgi:hypothetical protein